MLVAAVMALPYSQDSPVAAAPPTDGKHADFRFHFHQHLFGTFLHYILTSGAQFTVSIRFIRIRRLRWLRGLWWIWWLWWIWRLSRLARGTESIRLASRCTSGWCRSRPSCRSSSCWRRSYLRVDFSQIFRFFLTTRQSPLYDLAFTSFNHSNFNHVLLWYLVNSHGKRICWTVVSRPTKTIQLDIDFIFFFQSIKLREQKAKQDFQL